MYNFLLPFFIINTGQCIFFIDFLLPLIQVNVYFLLTFFIIKEVNVYFLLTFFIIKEVNVYFLLTFFIINTGEVTATGLEPRTT